MRRLSEPEISTYVKLGEGVGKVGGYAIQGRAALFVEGTEGDHTNALRMPFASRVLKEYGLVLRGSYWGVVDTR